MKLNSLVNEKSEYLRQHSNNPVNWYPWGDIALKKAKSENKIIILSIGYSSCHWCHVMEKESFQNKSIADFMNKFFISIKVDREERPDIDNIYMDAIQLMGINGGWPLNVFLLPNLKPFYGGTYFNPSQWIGVLNGIKSAYSSNKKEFEKSSESFTKELNTSSVIKYGSEDNHSIKSLAFEIKLKFDKKYGGIKRIQKFPMSSLWNSLLFYSLSSGDKEIYNHVTKTANSIIEGGIFDHLDGGFFRYSTDTKWNIPHFEKMIYDNGLLLDFFSNMFSLTRNKSYKYILDETYKWIQRDMIDESGGFYSSVDADSEGEEGKFYLWNKNDIKKILNKKEYEYAEEIFNLSNSNDYKDQIIIKRKFRNNEKDELFQKIKRKLFTHRYERTHPNIDKKIILSWNSILLKGLIQSYLVLKDEKYLKTALKNANFLINEFINKKKLKRIYGMNLSAFLEDYAHTISAFIKLYEATNEIKYLTISRKLTEDSIKLFYNKKEFLFNFSGKNNEKLIANKIQIFDDVIPSSNSVMFHNLLILGKCYNDPLYLQIFNNMSTKLKLFLNNYEFLSNWIFVNEINKVGIYEIQILNSKNKKKTISEINSWYVPNKIYSIKEPNNDFSVNKLSIILCRNNVCDSPISSIKKLKNKIYIKKNS